MEDISGCGFYVLLTDLGCPVLCSFFVNLSLLLLCEAFIVSIFVMYVMFDLATKLVKKERKRYWQRDVYVLFALK